MEKILVKIADILDMSVDSVFQSYPAFREQYRNSYIFKELASYAGIASFVLNILGIFITYWLIETWISKKDKKYIKVIVAYWIITGAIFLLEIYLKYKVIQTAPDLMFIKSII